MDVGIAQAKDSFSELIDRAEAGEVVTITRDGRAVVTLNPARGAPASTQMEAWLSELEARRPAMPHLSDDQIVTMVKADRRE